MLGPKIRSTFACGFALVPKFVYGQVPALTLLNYHYFTRNSPETYLEVSVGAFQRQICAIRERYTIGALDSQLSCLFECGSDRPMVSLCADDGCQGIDSIMQMIEEDSVPITLFICPGLAASADEIDGLRSRVLRSYEQIAPEQRTSRFGDPEACFVAVMGSSIESLRQLHAFMQPMMTMVDPIAVRPLLSLERLRSLASHPLVTIAAHSMSHPPLASIPAAWREWEIERSLHYVRELGGNTQLFAYRHGNAATINQDTVVALQKAGVRYAFTTSAYRIYASCDPFRLGRTPMYDVSAKLYVLGTVGGAMELYDRARLGRTAWQDYIRSTGNPN